MDRNALYQRWAGVVAVLLCIAVFIAMKPIAVPLVLAAWTATLAQPIHRKLGGGGIAAGAMTAVLIVALIAILGLLYAFLAQGAAGLASSLERADSPQAAFEALVTPGEAPADLREDRLPIVTKDEDKTDTAAAKKTASTDTARSTPTQSGVTSTVAAAAPSR